MDLDVISFHFPTPRHWRYSAAMRRDPDRDELEFAFLFFLLVLPVGYWMLQGVFALVGIG